MTYHSMRYLRRGNTTQQINKAKPHSSPKAVIFQRKIAAMKPTTLTFWAMLLATELPKHIHVHNILNVHVSCVDVYCRNTAGNRYWLPRQPLAQEEGISPRGLLIASFLLTAHVVFNLDTSQIRTLSLVTRVSSLQGLYCTCTCLWEHAQLMFMYMYMYASNIQAKLHM